MMKILHQIQQPNSIIWREKQQYCLKLHRVCYSSIKYCINSSIKEMEKNKSTLSRLTGIDSVRYSEVNKTCNNGYVFLSNISVLSSCSQYEDSGKHFWFKDAVKHDLCPLPCFFSSMSLILHIGLILIYVCINKAWIMESNVPTWVFS